MALRIKSSQDFWTGCTFTAFGMGTVLLSQAHHLGTAARMGPGYFPTALGATLVGIGLIIVLRSLTSASGGDVGRVDVLLLIRVLLAVAAFAFLLHSLGLMLVAFIVVLVAAHAGHEFRLGDALVSATVLALLSYLLFVRALNQTMPVWPWFLAN